VFIKDTVREEIIAFQANQYHLSRSLQDWAGERVKFAELLADNERRLADQMETLPLGD
jgi:sorting nexin-8